MGVCDIFLEGKEQLPKEVVDKIKAEVARIEQDFPNVEVDNKLLSHIVRTAVQEKKIELGNTLSDLQFKNVLQHKITEAKTPLELAKVADNYSGSLGIGGGKNAQYSRNNLLYNANQQSSNAINGFFSKIPEFKRLAFDEVLNTAVSKERFGIDSGNPIAKRITTVMNTTTENLIGKMEKVGMSARYLKNWGKRQSHEAGALHKLGKENWVSIAKKTFANQFDDPITFDTHLKTMYDKIVDEANLNPKNSSGYAFGKRDLLPISPEKAYEYNQIMGGDDSFSSYTNSYSNLYRRFMEYQTLGHGGLDNLKEGLDKIAVTAEHRAKLSTDKKVVAEYNKVHKSIKNGHIAETFKTLSYGLYNNNDYSSLLSQASRGAGAVTNMLLLPNSTLREGVSAHFGNFASTYLLGEGATKSLYSSLKTIPNMLKNIANKKELARVIHDRGVNLSLQKTGSSSVADASGNIALNTKNKFVSGLESLEGLNHKVNLLDLSTLTNKAESANNIWNTLINVAKGESLQPRLQKTFDSYGITKKDIDYLKTYYKKNNRLDVSSMGLDSAGFETANKLSGMVNSLGNMVSPTGALDSKISFRTENDGYRAISDLLTKYLSIGSNAVKSRLRVSGLISGEDVASAGVMGDYVNFGKSAFSLKGFASVSAIVLSSVSEYFIYSIGRDIVSGKDPSEKDINERFMQALKYGDLTMPQISATFDLAESLVSGRGGAVNAPVLGAGRVIKKDFKDGVFQGLAKTGLKLVPGMNAWYSRELTKKYIIEGLLGMKKPIKY